MVDYYKNSRQPSSLKPYLIESNCSKPGLPDCSQSCIPAVNATGDMKKMQARFTEVLSGQGMKSVDIAAKLKNFHFTRDPMSGDWFSTLCI
jgi:hypothetical protein